MKPTAIEKLVRDMAAFLQVLIRDSDKLWGGRRTAHCEKRYRSSERLVGRFKKLKRKK